MAAAACSCFICSHASAEPLELCPRCGARMFSLQRVRIFGGLFIACGGVLALMGLVLLVILAPAVLDPALRPGANLDFNGTPQQGRIILAVLACLLGLGAGILALGISTVRSGVVDRRMRRVGAATAGCGALMFLLASLF